MKKLCASLNSATCKIGDAVQSKLRSAQRRGQKTPPPSSAPQAPVEARLRDASDDRESSVWTESAATSMSSGPSGGGAKDSSSCSGSHTGGPVYEGPAILSDLVTETISGPPPPSDNGSTLFVRRVKKHGLGATIPSLVAAAAKRRNSNGDASLSSASDSTFGPSPQWLNLRTLEFAISDILPPDITNFVEDDEQLLVRYRALQLHAAVALCTGCCDRDMLYQLRTTLVRSSTRKPAQGTLALGNRSGCIDADALEGSLKRCKDTICTWAHKAGKEAEFAKYVRLYASWALAAYHSLEIDVLPCILQDMERLLPSPSAIDIDTSPRLAQKVVISGIGGSLNHAPMTPCPKTPTRFAFSGESCPTAPATATCFGGNCTVRPSVVPVQKGHPELMRGLSL